jgi:hypothetical protein
VKQSNKFLGVRIVLGIICLAVIVFAGLEATHYNAPTHSAITQQAEKNKLATKISRPVVTPKKSATPHSTSPVASLPQPAVAKPAPTTLINTGPGSVMPFFVLSVGTVYGSSIWFRYRQAKKFTDV